MLKSLHFFCFLVISHCKNNTINSYFELIKSDPILLRIFVEKLPKGAELHNHLIGSAHPEDLLSYSYTHPEMCLNTTGTKVYVAEPSKPCPLPLNTALTDPKLYKKVIRAWSLYNFRDVAPNFELTRPEDKFFGAFSKYMALTNVTKGDILAQTLNQAADQRLSHVELMIFSRSEQLGDIARQIRNGTLKAMKKQAEKLRIDKAVQAFAFINLDNVIRRKDKILKCGTPQAQSGCNISYGFLACASRIVPLEASFVEVTALVLEKPTPCCITGTTSSLPSNGKTT